MTRTVIVLAVLATLMAAPAGYTADIDRTAVDFTTPADIKWVRNTAGTNESAVLFGDPRIMIEDAAIAFPPLAPVFRLDRPAPFVAFRVLQEHNWHQHHAKFFPLGVIDQPAQLLRSRREAHVEVDSAATAVFHMWIDNEHHRIRADVHNLIDALLIFVIHEIHTL